MVAIITLTLSSTLLVACLAVATLNVVLRRESTNVVEKQINTLVEANQGIAPAILEGAGACVGQNVNSGVLEPLALYVRAAFPQATISVAADSRLPKWLPGAGFTGIVADHGQLEIRNIAVRNEGTCRVTAMFRMSLGTVLAKRLSLRGGSDVIAVSPRQFYVGGLSRKILGMLESNFISGSPRGVGRLHASVFTEHEENLVVNPRSNE